MFARDGYLNAKISDIAAAAGRSVASFYNYYDTKADLLIALAEEFHAEASQLAALPYRAGLSGEEALREAVAGFWRTYAKRRGELIGIFQAAMVEGRFRDRWLELRGEAITRIATAVRKAQADGYCPGVDPVMTASALSAMLEHFCYIWLGQGGEKDVPFDDDLALDALCTIWVKAVYWKPGRQASSRPAERPARQHAGQDAITCRLPTRRQRSLAPAPGQDAGRQPPERDDVVQRDAQEPDDGDDRDGTARTRSGPGRR